MTFNGRVRHMTVTIPPDFREDFEPYHRPKPLDGSGPVCGGWNSKAELRPAEGNERSCSLCYGVLRSVNMHLDWGPGGKRREWSAA